MKTVSESEESVTIIGNDGTCKSISVRDYRDYEADANTVRSARIQLHNERFLERIPDVMIGSIVGLAIKLFGENKKREEARQKVRAKLQQEVFPQILKEIENGVEMAVTKQVKQVNTSIEAEIKNQNDVLEKALADVRGRISDEKTRKEKLEADIQADLERIGEIKNGL